MILNQEKHACPCNHAVTCPETDDRGRALVRDCSKCGWNPEVAQNRLQKLFPNYKGAENQTSA